MMPTNPEQEARDELVTMLQRGAERIEGGTFSTADGVWMRQAANEIEDLAEKLPVEKSEAFRDSWHRVIEEMEDVLSMMRDPFKAPEQSIEMFPGLLAAIWLLQVEWTVTCRA